MTSPGEFASSQTPNLVNPRHYQAVANAMEVLLVERSDILFADEDEETGKEMGWLRRLDVVDPAIPKASITISLYSEEARESQAEILRAEGIEVTRPVGSIQFNLLLSNAAVDGALYLDAGGQVIGEVNCSVPHIDEFFSDDSESCFDLMDAMGLGKILVKCFWFEGNEELKVGFKLDDRMASNLSHFLTAQQGQSPSQ